MPTKLFGVCLFAAAGAVVLGALGNRGTASTAAETAAAPIIHKGEIDGTTAPFGIERRTLWTTSNFRGRPEPPPPYRAEPLFPKLTFQQTTLIATTPALDRLFVGERKGKIFSIANRPGTAQADLFLDAAQLIKRLSASSPKPLEFDSLYGLEFDPRFAENRYCYVCYVVRHRDRSKHPEGTRVVRFKVSSSDPPQCDVASETLIISWLEGGHNGGCLKFGPDGYLYVSSGDGGNAFPPDGLNSGQDLSRLLAKIMRIDVHPQQSDKPYAIPSDNPFVSLDKARGETWAYGLRNPWKMSFDRQTGALWVGDVGWELWELVYHVEKGDNFGWSIVEGRQQVHAERKPGPTPIKPPTLEIPHTEGASVTGGFVYRGRELPELLGTYVFGDWETRRVWGVKVDGEQVGERRELIDPTVRIVDFAEDRDGELLLLDHDDGSVLRLVRNDLKQSPHVFPRKLSDSGIFSSVTQHLPAQGVLPFSINAPQWNDHAVSERLLGLPGDGAIQIHAKPVPVLGSQFSRAIDYPKDAVLVKTLSLDMVHGDPASRKRIETQVLHYDGRDWQGYTYEWNDQQSDAELVDRTGKTRVLQVVDKTAPDGRRTHNWVFASRTECLRCHNPWSEYSLAFNIPQINRPHEYSGARDNQIRTFRHIGVLQDVIEPVDPLDPFAKPVPPKPATELPKLTDPYEASGDLDARARSYLHVNCAYCHRFNGGGSSYIYLNHDLALGELKAVGVRPTQGTFGIHEAQILTPGDPYRSVMYFRLAKTGPGHMPHIGAKVIDQAGLQLMHDWIRQLPLRFEDQNKLEQLAELDEAAVLAREAADAPRTRWQLARKLAKADGREQPSQDDLAAAETQAREQADGRIKQRAASRPKLINELLATPSQSMLLAMAVRDGKLPDSIRALVLEAAMQREDLAIRDLFEPFVPESQRTKRLGESIAAGDILKLSGDTARGRQLFHESTVVQCRNCHRLDNKGTELGSDLSQIGKKYDRGKILENILQPSLTIDPKYAAWLVETRSGKVFTGLLVKEDEKELVIKDVQNKLHRIPLEDKEGLYPQRKSLMPDLLLRDFTAQQVADLLAYLASLK